MCLDCGSNDTDGILKTGSVLHKRLHQIFLQPQLSFIRIEILEVTCIKLRAQNKVLGKKTRANCFKISLPIQHEISWNPSHGEFTLPDTETAIETETDAYIDKMGILCWISVSAV